MANDNASSYYFTIVVYPHEMKADTIFKLHNIGTLFISPIHNSFKNKEQQNYYNYVACNQDYLLGNLPKPHQHILFKSSNKMTENAFIKKLCDTLGNDFTGVALHKGDSLVKSPDMMIRYFYHLDNPLKEKFNIELAFEDVVPNFTDEVVKAFNLEITLRVSFGIQSEELKNIQDIITLYSNSAVTTKWLYTGRNMYVVNSMFNELRRK